MIWGYPYFRKPPYRLTFDFPVASTEMLPTWWLVDGSSGTHLKRPRPQVQPDAAAELRRSALNMGLPPQLRLDKRCRKMSKSWLWSLRNMFNFSHGDISMIFQKKSDHDLVKGFSWLGQRLLPRTTTYNSQCMVPVQKAVDPKWSSDLKRAWDRDRRDGRKWMGSTWFQSRSPGFTRFTVYPMRFGIADSRKSPGNQPGKQPVRHEFSASGADWRNAQRIQYDNRLSASTTGSISPDAWKTLARVSLDHGIPWRAGRRFRCFLTRYPRGFGCNFMQFPYISITCGGWWLQNGRNMYKKNLESSEPFPQLTIFML